MEAQLAAERAETERQQAAAGRAMEDRIRQTEAERNEILQLYDRMRRENEDRKREYEALR